MCCCDISAPLQHSKGCGPLTEITGNVLVEETGRSLSNNDCIHKKYDMLSLSKAGGKSKEPESQSKNQIVIIPDTELLIQIRGFRTNISMKHEIKHWEMETWHDPCQSDNTHRLTH